MKKPAPETHAPIDTRSLGLAQAFNTPAPNGKSDKPGLYQVIFDTGVILYLPEGLFKGTVFHLEEV